MKTPAQLRAFLYGEPEPKPRHLWDDADYAAAAAKFIGRKFKELEFEQQAWVRHLMHRAPIRLTNGVVAYRDPAERIAMQS